jgi:inner membrane transporter RhtA
MLSVQLGAALSVGLFALVGPAGTAWLRLTAGAIVLALLVRPSRQDVPQGALLPLLALGVTIAVMTVAFLAAIDRIPLGTTVAIEFLGPLTVAAARAHDRRMLAWPFVALMGVVLLTRPWEGRVDLLGILFAAAAAVGWGTYILLTQHVGDRVSGVTGVAITIPIAALVAAPVGLPQAIPGLSLGVVLAAFALALLLPVLPFALEMLALRRLTAAAFGTLMALEPGFAVVIGALVLRQLPSPVQVLGVILVIVAGVGAERRGRRSPSGSAAIEGAA